MRYRYEGFKVGQRIRAYDFPTAIMAAVHRKECYIEGTITAVRREGDRAAPFAHYHVEVDTDTLYEEEPRPAVLVPMESSMDWDGRVVLTEKSDERKEHQVLPREKG